MLRKPIASFLNSSVKHSLITFNMQNATLCVENEKANRKCALCTPESHREIKHMIIILKQS